MKELGLNDVFSILKKRSPESNKGDYGTLLSVVGSAFYRGAAQLSSLGALRTGVGILRVCSVEKVVLPLSANIPEAVLLPMAEGEKGEMRSFDTKGYFNEFPKTTALLCGCGLTTFGNIGNIVKDIIANSSCPLILDADALNSISKERDILLKAREEVIITPHIGEFSRLCGVSIEDIKNDPLKYGKEFAKNYSLTLVLKGSDTYIITPHEEYISRLGNPGLARGGSGDILAGMIASFRAQGYSALESAKCGVLLHGAAADRCAARLSQTGMLPSDILSDLCEIFKEEGY